MEHSGRSDSGVPAGSSRRAWDWRRLSLHVIWIGCLLLGLAGSFLRYIGVFGGNVRVVAPGRVYRSALLPPDQLQELIRERNIRTVISLCGGEPKNAWFRRQADVCRAEGVDFRVVRLQASNWPKPVEVARLLSYYQTARYPVLIHCRGGADRSGLASVLYLNEFAQVPLARALQEGLTWRYGHFRRLAPKMDEFFELYGREQAQIGLGRWVLERYPKLYPKLRAAARNARRANGAPRIKMLAAPE